MTEKEKAKAYDEAIEKAKKWHNIPNPIYCNIITEKIFPELKKSEDEELKKLVEPKFKVGDKIVNVPMKYWGASVTQGTISKITEDKYIFTDGSRMSISSQDSWELVSNKKPKFDPKTLQPFDRVLVNDHPDTMWKVDFYSHKDESKAYPYRCIGNSYTYCIPYNYETKQLVGTTDEAPEYYRYWED